MKFIEKYNINNNKNRIISVLSILSILIFLINIILPTTVHADDTTDKSITTPTDTKPMIDIQYKGTDPQKPLVGQDVLVKYQIIPQPFQHNVPKPKEIVLVLDKSGSMKDKNDEKKMTNLKNAAKKFIESMTKIDKETNIPEVTDLSIGIVAYDSYGSVKSEVIQVTDGSRVNSGNVRKLNSSIDSISANGGTNIGDGLRKGTYLLDKSDKDANKTIIFMADGEPTYYSYYNGKGFVCECSKPWCNNKGMCNSENMCTVKHNNSWQYEKKCGVKDTQLFYEKLDNTNPNKDGTGNSDTEGKCLAYSKKIGDIIRNKNYNVFSIGYGLGTEASTSNIKMKEIHESMGGVTTGENSTFFATDSGAIDKIFEKISEQLIKSYSITDAQLNLNLADGITAVDGFEIGNENGGKIKLKPIVYKLGENNWYKADPVEVIFKIKANKAGEYPMFGPNSNLEYTDINGNKVSVPIKESTITVEEVTLENQEKLQVSFYPEKNGYLVGDIVQVAVGFTHPGTEGTNFTNAKFDITDGIPESLELAEGSPVLDFGKIDANTPVKKYKFKIKETTSGNIEANHTINGKYLYDVDKNGSNKVSISDTQTTMVDIKRGQVIVSIEDTEGRPVNGDVKVVLKNELLDMKSTEIKNGVVKFDNIPSGNYNLKLTDIPDGYEFTDGSDAIVAVYYDKVKDTNIAKWKFVLKGNEHDSKVTIEASDSSGKVNDIYNSEDGKDTRYDKFIENEFGNEYKLFGESYADIKFSGEKLNYLQYQILKSDTNPTTMPSEGWSEITAKDNGINEDIDLDNQGKLTQKAYSVSQMNGLNTPGYNPNSWKDNKIVYQYPIDGVRYVDASRAKTKEEYTEKGTIIDPVTGEIEEVWIPKKVFTETVNYTGENYKEASKTWGYFKAPESGYYYFRTHSDDGIRFTITTEDTTNLLVDRFDAHPPTYHRASNAVKLEKDQYYPVFIEYFNVGGAAAFGVQYVVNEKDNINPKDSQYKYVDAGSFYPSKSTIPGESSDGSFEGQDGVKFPEEEGSYYVAYRGFDKEGDKQNLMKEGFYGPFIVEDRFTLERKVENDTANLGEDFKIKYNIIPKDIRVTDLYKNKDELKEENMKTTVDIKNMQLKDTIPEGITVNKITVEPEGGKAITNIDKDKNTIEIRFGVNSGEENANPVGIKYDLVRDPNDNSIEKAVYKAKPITVTIDVTANEQKEYVFRKKIGKLMYNDVSLKNDAIMKESYFGETRFELRESGSIDIKHINYTPKEPTVGEVIDVNYQIVPKPFKESTRATREEIILVLDAGKSMSGTNLEKMKKDAASFGAEIQKYIREHEQHNNPTNILNNMKVGVVAYGKSASIANWPYTILEDANHQQTINFINSIKILEGENLGEALRKAECMFTSSKSVDSANKTIIVMSDGISTNYSVYGDGESKGKYYLETDNETYEGNENLVSNRIPEIWGLGTRNESEYLDKSTEYAKQMGGVIKNKDYNVVTIGYGLDDSKIKDNVNEIHYSMGGTSNTLFEGENENVVLDVIKKIDEITGEDLARQNYIFKDVELKVTSGDGFVEVDGFGASENKSHTIKIPEIKYVLNSETKQYESAPIPMKFKIKADNPGKYPVLNPTSKNRLEYTDFDGQRVSMQVPNPEITVTDNIYEGIKHGLYEGIEGNTINIIEKDTIIAGGTNVNFGATFVTKSNIPKITLTVDEKINANDIKNKKVYQLKDSKLEEVRGAKITATTNKNVYDIVLPPGIDKDTTILIRYSTKLPVSKDTPYTNNIKVGVSEKPAKVTTTNVEEKDRLPDLF